MTKVFGRSGQLSLNKFFDLTTPSMRKGRDGGNGKKLMKIVATTSLPAVDINYIVALTDLILNNLKS